MTKILRAIASTEGPQAHDEWGDNSGYQYDHSDRDSFYRQWWLANETGIIFIVY